MSVKRSITHRRLRKKIRRDFELQLTSMMDMLIILVVFLLKSYAANSIAFTTSPNITLPTTTADELPGDTINLVIDPYSITVDNEKVLEFKNPPAPPASPTVAPKPSEIAKAATYEIDPYFLTDGGRRILPLYDGLVRLREKSELLMSKAVWKDKEGKPTTPKFQGVVIIHADKGIRYELLRKVMYTAGAAQYRIFKLVATKKDAG